MNILRLQEIATDGVLGSDETGTGDYFTPIVSACVFIPPKNLTNFLKYKNLDSKKVSDKFVVEFFEGHKHLFLYTWNNISQKTWNKLNQKYNANQIKLFLHYSNITYFFSQHKVEVKQIVIDQFSTLKTLESYEKTLLKTSPHLDIQKHAPLVWLTHAETQVFAVGVASIVARYFLLKLMTKQKQTWQFHFPLGASKTVDIAAKDFIARYGEDKLKNVAKITFSNTKRILEDRS